MDPERAINVLLTHPVITPDTKAIIYALLAHALDVPTLSLAIVQRTIGHALRASNEEFQPPFTVDKQTFEAYLQQISHPCSLAGHADPRVDYCLAMGLKDEVNDWNCDFLLYVTGKRQVEQHCWTRDNCWISEGMLFPPEECPALTEAYLKRELLQQEVDSRDGPDCVATLAEENVVCVKIIPDSLSLEKFERFKYLASVFFCNKYDEILNREHLDSPSNAFNLKYEWMVFFDDGRFVLRERNGSVYIECLDLELLGEPDFCRPGADGCDEEDGNGLKLHFPYDDVLYRRQPVDSQLTSLHAAIVRTWVATGQLPRHVEDCRRLQTISPRYQHYSALGERNFHNVLTHRLTLL